MKITENREYPMPVGIPLRSVTIELSVKEIDYIKRYAKSPEGLPWGVYGSSTAFELIKKLKDIEL